MKRLLFVLLSVALLGVGCPSFKSQPQNRVADGGVYKTTDGGETWAAVNTVPTAQGTGTLSTTNVINMEMDPQDRSFLYAGTRANGLIYSEDAAASWRIPRYAAFREGTIRAVEVDPTNICTVYIAKDARLYKSENCLRSVSDGAYVEARPGVVISQIGVDWYNRGTVYIGLTNGDVLKSIDGGKSWKTILKTEKEISEILIHNKDSRQLLLTLYDGGVFRSTDAGETWQTVGGKVKDLAGASRVYGIVQTADASVVLMTTEYGLLRSKDFGLTWEPLQLLTAPKEALIRAIGISPSNGNLLYYATPSAFYQSLDGGQTWQTKKFPSERIPRALIVDPKDPKVVYIGVAEELK